LYWGLSEVSRAWRGLAISEQVGFPLPIFVKGDGYVQA